jgi:hypothetical protein
MIKLQLCFLCCISSAQVTFYASADSFTLWQAGAFRGANVMQAQCTVADLRVLPAKLTE